MEAVVLIERRKISCVSFDVGGSMIETLDSVRYHGVSLDRNMR